MKVLYIGNPEWRDTYTEPSDFTSSVDMVDMPMCLSAQEYLAKAADADVIVTDVLTQINAELIGGMPNLKMIHSQGVGYNSIDIACAREHGVDVCNPAGMNAQAVAEHTVMLMLGVLRDVTANDRAVRDGRQMEVKNDYLRDGSLRDLAECKVGLVGLGSIGRRTAALLKAFGARVFYTQRHRASAQVEAECGVEWVESREELLRECDIVSVHVPVTDATRHMCDEKFFSCMKPGAYFINTSRGELVDDAALIAALASGRLAMAGLDVLDGEPITKDHVMLAQPEEIEKKLLLSPHIGGVTNASMRTSYRIIWDNIRRVSEGEKPINIVN